MRFADLLATVKDSPVFETSLLLAGDENPADVRRQLSRWTRVGKLHQLRRGVYAVAPPYQRTSPHPFHVANVMVTGSFVSCQTALGYYGLLPEHVPTTTSVCASRPRQWKTALGRFTYRHLKVSMLTGYRRVELGDRQHAFVAEPEKALLDLVYLHPGGDRWEYLTELRLQHMEDLDLDRLELLAQQSGSPKLRRAASRITNLARQEAAEYEAL